MGITTCFLSLAMHSKIYIYSKYWRVTILMDITTCSSLLVMHDKFLLEGNFLDNDPQGHGNWYIYKSLFMLVGKYNNGSSLYQIFHCFDLLLKFEKSSLTFSSNYPSWMASKRSMDMVSNTSRSLSSWLSIDKMYEELFTPHVDQQ